MGLLRNARYYQQVKQFAEASADWGRLAGKSVLITGASGMIGKFLADILMYRNTSGDAGISITACARNRAFAAERFEEYQGHPLFCVCGQDVNDPFPNTLKADYIIHAASNTHPLQYATDPVGTITANVVGTKNVLDLAARQQGCRVAFLSSVDIYGENRTHAEGFRECDMGYIDCNSLRAGYPESKRTGEALCQAYGAAHGLDFVIARLSRVYGPTMLQTDSKAVAQFIKNAVLGEDIVLKSDGGQCFSYTYAGDAAYAVLYCLLQGGRGEAYNIAGEHSDVTLKELAKMIADAAGTQVVYRAPSQTEELGFSKARHAVLQTQKLRGLGWFGCYRLQEGLAETVKILRQHNGDCAGG